MHGWLVRHGWVEDYVDSPFARTMSYIAFIMMPGCLIGAIIDRALSRD